MRAATWLVPMVGVLAVMAGQASAQTAAPAPQLNSQQEKMKECAADAKTKGVTGADRKTFMSSCLSAKGVTNEQQQKMKTCNADANVKALKGDERKAFMKSCLSGSG